MRIKKKWPLIGAVLLAVVVFVSTGLVIAEPNGPFAYPGPFGPYEDDTVTVACVQIFRGADSSATLNKMLVKAKEAIEAGADIVLFCRVHSKDGGADTWPVESGDGRNNRERQERLRA